MGPDFARITRRSKAWIAPKHSGLSGRRPFVESELKEQLDDEFNAEVD